MTLSPICDVVDDSCVMTHHCHPKADYSPVKAGVLYTSCTRPVPEKYHILFATERQEDVLL